MIKMAPGWKHESGAHCASTAISDLMRFFGLPLSEAMCFGLGAGLGFAYFESEAMDPTRMTATRSRLLEPRFFESIGVPFDWKLEDTPDNALREAKEYIDRGLPFLMRADIRHLPYYQSSTSFPPHVIAMCGYDDDKGVALVADTEWEGEQEVPYEDLLKARYSGNAYIKNRADHFVLETLPEGIDIAGAAKRAIIQQARDLMGMELDMPAVFGFKAMQTAASRIPEWKDAKDRQWCARWFYQVIEKRGTGGGAFRLLYSRFCEEAGELAPEIGKAAPAKEMRRIAGMWTELSEVLKEASESEDSAGLHESAGLLSKITEAEAAFFKKASDALGGASL